MNSNVFLQSISVLMPSQLYISEEKLRNVQVWFDNDISKMDPIPIKKLAGRILITDGHTRATAAWLAGIKEIPCIWDTDDMDWVAYAADINMCSEEGITSVAKLAERIVSVEDYKHLWHDRCDEMYSECYYALLKQQKETIFFTRNSTEVLPCDIRPVDLGINSGEYYQLFIGDLPVATGCIEKYSYEFWEVSDIKTKREFRNQGYAHQVTAFLTNLIVKNGKTATCRTLPENAVMNRIIENCGYHKLYE